MKFTLKILPVVVALFLGVSQTVCYALIEGLDNHGTLEPSQLALGYISVTSKPADILNIYGHPTRVDNRNGVRWFYGKDFFIQFIGRDSTTVGEVTTTGNNGITTANKVGVGMSESILRRVYGSPTYQKRVGDEQQYWYYGNKRCNWVYLYFGCKRGIIRKISLVWLD